MGPMGRPVKMNLRQFSTNSNRTLWDGNNAPQRKTNMKIWASIACVAPHTAAPRLFLSAILWLALLFLADRTNGRAYATVLRLSSVVRRPSVVRL